MTGTCRKDFGAVRASDKLIKFKYAIIGEKRAEQIARVIDYYNLGELEA